MNVLRTILHALCMSGRPGTLPLVVKTCDASHHSKLTERVAVVQRCYKSSGRRRPEEAYLHEDAALCREEQQGVNARVGIVRRLRKA